MTPPIVNTSDLPAECIGREKQQNRGQTDEVQGNVDNEEEQKCPVKESWWGEWVSYEALTQQLSIDADCTAHPLTIGCDGLLVVLTAILAVLVALRARVDAVERGAKQPDQPVAKRAELQDHPIAKRAERQTRHVAQRAA